MDILTLNDLFLRWSGVEPESVEELGAQGSTRRYFRMVGGGRSAIGTIGNDKKENSAFIYMSRHLRSRGVQVPECYAVSSDEMCYIQEDLGDESLYTRLSGSRRYGYDEADALLLEKVAANLAKWQQMASDGMDWEYCYPQPSLDRRSVEYDLNYFKYCFLKPMEVLFEENPLQDDFDRLREALVGGGAAGGGASGNAAAGDGTRALLQGFMFRDFQSRNIMLRGDEPYVIDFQGGRRGPVCYDLASFVLQASAAYPDWLKCRIVDAFYAEIKNLLSRREFDRQFALTSLFRTLQVLGAYGFRGCYEGKEYFKNCIPQALKNLRDILSGEIGEEYPYLKILSSRLMSEEVCAPKDAPKDDPKDDPKSATQSTGGSTEPTLTVTIYSFSFKKGIPEDASGNGGGYVFDCRGYDNPGRYERYKKLTGRDAEVIEFLDNVPQCQAFIENVLKIVDAHCENFIERGFTHLQVNFGCTGGQHRSVYCAEKTARHLKEKYGVNVKLIHRELGI